MADGHFYSHFHSACVATHSTREYLVRHFHWAADLFRCAMLLVSCWNIALLTVVFRRWLVMVPKDGRRLLFRHVAFVSAATIVFIIAADAETIERIGRPFVWRGTPIAFVANVLLCIAFFNMIGWLKVRSQGQVVPADANAPSRRWTDPNEG